MINPNKDNHRLQKSNETDDVTEDLHRILFHSPILKNISHPEQYGSKEHAKCIKIYNNNDNQFSSQSPDTTIDNATKNNLNMDNSENVIVSYKRDDSNHNNIHNDNQEESVLKSIEIPIHSVHEHTSINTDDNCISESDANTSVTLHTDNISRSDDRCYDCENDHRSKQHFHNKQSKCKDEIRTDTESSNTYTINTGTSTSSTGFIKNAHVFNVSYSHSEKYSDSYHSFVKHHNNNNKTKINTVLDLTMTGLVLYVYMICSIIRFFITVDLLDITHRVVGLPDFITIRLPSHCLNRLNKNLRTSKHIY